MLGKKMATTATTESSILYNLAPRAQQEPKDEQ
jgi:hypothetical protein